MGRMELRAVFLEGGEEEEAPVRLPEGSQVTAETAETLS